MGRLNNKARTYVLEKPHRRGIGITGKLLWKTSIFNSRLLFAYLPHFLGLLTCCMSVYFIVAFGLTNKKLPMNGGVILLIIFSPLIIACFMIVIYAIFQKKSGRKYIKERELMEFEDFISCSPQIQKSEKKYVSIIREILAYVYCVDPRFIYPNDTAESLRNLGNLNDPFGYEVVLGVAKKIGVNISDKEVTQIIKKIHKNADNVEKLVALLSEEMAGRN